ncbi:MAG: hypothetical protein ACO201_00005, partial [Rickettsiales bacterium]
MTKDQPKPYDYKPTESEIREAIFRDFYKYFKEEFKDPNQSFNPGSAINSGETAFIFSNLARSMSNNNMSIF